MAKAVIAALTAALLAALWTASMAQTSSGCTNVLISLSPCLNYITGNSSAPSTGCCSQLTSVVKSQPQCLCEAITGNAAASLGLNINRTQALQLPTACKIQTPSISRCSGASSPSGSPSTTTSGSPHTSTTTTPSSSTGTTAVPSIETTSDGYATKKGAIGMLIAIVLIVTAI